MRITFRGWRRQVYAHTVEVVPVAKSKYGGGYIPVSGRKSLSWSNERTAFGKVSDLSLSGAFLAELQFTDTELKNWLTRYLIEKPEDALRIIAAAQADAIRRTSNAKKSKQ